MPDAAPESLILDLLEWVAGADRTYDEVMDAWRTSCPRLPVWEDANDRGRFRVCVQRSTFLRLSLSFRTVATLAWDYYERTGNSFGHGVIISNGLWTRVSGVYTWRSLSGGAR
jgi:hypothetical protein